MTFLIKTSLIIQMSVTLIVRRKTWKNLEFFKEYFAIQRKKIYIM